MGCTASSPAPVRKQDNVRGENFDVEDIEDENPEYPLPYVPETTKSDIWDLEVNRDIQDRIENMPPGTDADYKTLLKYLSDGATKEVHHATAIYLWMKSQDYDSPSLDEKELDQQTHGGRRTNRDSRVYPNSAHPQDTPRSYMKLIKDGKGDFTTFFTILCRRSGIPCNIIRGLAKDEKFYIGMNEQQMASKWTTFFADQEWRLAHIEWAMENRTDKNQNIDRSDISDFYFLTDPEDFAHYCHPDDFNWQLLNQPYSKKEFLSLPNFRYASFILNTNILSPKHSTIKTSRSSTEIEICFPKKIMEDTELSYVYKFQQELTSKKEDQFDTRSKLPKSLKNFVFINRRQTKFVFEIQFPAAGKYLFDIYAKHYGEENQLNKHSSKTANPEFERLVQFRLICELDPDGGDVDPLPECPEHGWGPGPNCRHLGLVPLTHFDSYIFIKPGDIRDIRFQMKSKLEVQCQLTHNYLPIYQLVEQIEQEIDRDEVHTKVRIPEEGTYALKIFCRPTGTKEFNEACVYLLKQQVQSRLPENYERGYRRKYRDKMIRSKLEYHLENHTKEQDLRDALEMYHCYNVPDHGELKRGHEKLKQYWEVKRELQLAIRGRNINNLEKWLERAKRSKYKSDLADEIQKAEALEGNMSKRKGYAHPIARMDEHTITEIHNYKRPPRVVHDVMKSTYILLGEDPEYLRAWQHIQYLMGRTGNEGLKKLILNRKVDDVSLDEASEAEMAIQPYNLDKCRAVSTGIGSFYKWCCQFIIEIKDHYAAEQRRLKELQVTQELTQGIETNVEPDGTMMSGGSVSLTGLSPDPPPGPALYNLDYQLGTYNESSTLTKDLPCENDLVEKPNLYVDIGNDETLADFKPHTFVNSNGGMKTLISNDIEKQIEAEPDLDRNGEQSGLFIINMDKEDGNLPVKDQEKQRSSENIIVSPLED